MIEVSHLVKKYGDHYAVNDLSFHVEKGQIYGFLGPNGAGKSTTMNIITGYLAPTSGEVLVNGHNIQTEPEEAKQCIGYLPEIPPVYQDMTVREYLEFAVELKKVPQRERAEQVDDVMHSTQIGDMRNRLIKNLSKGYKQRVGLAQAMLGNPEILILDEPTVGLDPKQIIEIRDLIKSLKGKHTIILSSHILSEVSAVCDQIMIISRGRLVAFDTSEGLTRRMTGESELIFSAKGTEEAVKACLDQIPQIKSYKTDVTEDIVHADVKLPVDCDIREELFYLLAQNRLPIYELHVSTKSLEDIFLKLTDSGTSIENMVNATKKDKEKKKSSGKAKTAGTKAGGSESAGTKKSGTKTGTGKSGKVRKKQDAQMQDALAQSDAELEELLNAFKDYEDTPFATSEESVSDEELTAMADALQNKKD